MKKLIECVCASMLLLLLGACGLPGPMPEKTTFQFGTVRPAIAVQSPRFNTLRVADFRVMQANRVSNLIYRETDQRYVADPYRVLLAPPGSLLAERTRAWLAASGLSHAVLPAGSSIIADANLEVEVSELYADVRDPRHPAAVLGLRAWLTNADGKLLRQEWHFEQRIALAKPDAAYVVAAWDQALQLALADLEHTLSR